MDLSLKFISVGIFLKNFKEEILRIEFKDAVQGSVIWITIVLYNTRKTPKMHITNFKHATVITTNHIINIVSI